MAEATSLTLGTPIVLAVGTSSAASAAIGTASVGQPTLATTCRLTATVDVWISIGANPTAQLAAGASYLLPAGAIEYVDIPNGTKVAAIGAAAGFLSVTPGAKN